MRIRGNPIDANRERHRQVLHTATQQGRVPASRQRDFADGRRGNSDRQGIQQERHGIPGRRECEVAAVEPVLERILPGASQLQNYHPLLVHFPIAFIYGASLLYFLAWITASERLQWTALWMLVLGAVSAAVALASGFYAAPGLMVAESVRNELLSHTNNLLE